MGPMGPMGPIGPIGPMDPIGPTWPIGTIEPPMWPICDIPWERNGGQPKKFIEVASTA